MHPVQQHEEQVLEENNHVLSIRGNGIALQVVVDNAWEERNALHVKRHRVQSRDILVHDDLHDLGKLHDSRAHHDAVAEALAYGVLQARNIRKRAVNEERTVARISNEVCDHLFHIF